MRDGRRLAYVEIGSAGGKPIVHCHGAPSSRVEGALVFDPAVATELGVRVIVPDRPGMGRSDFQPRRRIVDWPSDVKELADALRLDDFAVLGSSGGSPYALASARAARGLSPARSLRARCAGGGGMPARATMARMFPEPDRSLLQQRRDPRRRSWPASRKLVAVDLGGAVWDMALLGRPWGFDLEALDLPVALWHGERDRNVPVAHGRYLAGVIPGCRATFYAADAHLSTFVNHRRELLAALAE